MQIILALIAFGCAAALVRAVDGTGGTGLTVFTGLTTIIICITFMVASCVKGCIERTSTQAWVITEVVLASVWTVLWLTSAAMLSDNRWFCIFLYSIDSNGNYRSACNVWRSAEAFAWLSLFASIGSIVFPALKLCNKHGQQGNQGQGACRSYAWITMR